MSASECQRVAILTGASSSRVVLRELAQPQAGQVRVRLEGCGICASNIPVWEGRPWFEYPCAAGAPGHEGWGVVERLGPAVTDLEPGERVALISNNAYAQYDIAPRQALVRLPPELGPVPFPGEPLGCAINIFERSDIQAGQEVAIIGIGFLGLLLTQLAAAAGARVLAISRRVYALQLAGSMGAQAVLPLEDLAETQEQARKLSGGRGYQRVIEAAGLQSTLDLASALAAPEGKLIIAGYHQDGPRRVDMQQWNWRALEVINAHERSLERCVRGIERAAAAVLQGRLNPFALLTHEVTLEPLDRGFDLARTRPDGFMKAVLRLDGHERAA